MKTVGYANLDVLVELEKDGTFEEYQEYFHDDNDFEVELVIRKNGVVHKVKALAHSFDLNLVETEQIDE